MSAYLQKRWTSTPLTFLPQSLNQPWTDQDDQKLRQRVSEGWSRAEIAAEIGRTRMAVVGRCNRLGLRLPRDVLGGSRSIKSYEKVPVEHRAEMEARDRRMIRALAEAIYRGDHLPGRSGHAPTA